MSRVARKTARALLSTSAPPSRKGASGLAELLSNLRQTKDGALDRSALEASLEAPELREDVTEAPRAAFSSSEVLAQREAPAHAAEHEVLAHHDDVEGPRATLEDLPGECTAEDVKHALLKATGVDAAHVEFFQDTERQRERRNAFVTFASQEDYAKVVTPARVDFGLHVKGVRCNFFETANRQNRLFIWGLPYDSTSSEAEGLLYTLLQGITDLHINAPAGSGGRHRGFALLKGPSHDACRRAFRRLQGRSLGPESTLNVKWSHAATRQVKVNGEVQYDTFLHRIKERLRDTEAQLKAANALLEQQGYVVSPKGIRRQEMKSVPADIVIHALSSIPLDQMPTLAELKLHYTQSVVSQSQSVKKAAEVMGVSQPTVKRSLKEYSAMTIKDKAE